MKITLKEFLEELSGHVEYGHRKVKGSQMREKISNAFLALERWDDYTEIDIPDCTTP